MIVRFESANAAPARIIKVYADEDRVFLLILDCHTVVQFDKHIRGPSHHRFQLRFAQLAVKTLGDIESNHFLRGTVTAICAAIFPPVAGIYHHGIKSLTGVFDPGGRNGTASSQRSEKDDCKETSDLARHSVL